MVSNLSMYLFKKFIAQEKTLFLVVFNKQITFLTKMAVNFLVLETGLKWTHTHTHSKLQPF